MDELETIQWDRVPPDICSSNLFFTEESYKKYSAEPDLSKLIINKYVELGPYTYSDNKDLSEFNYDKSEVTSTSQSLDSEINDKDLKNHPENGTFNVNDATGKDSHPLPESLEIVKILDGANVAESPGETASCENSVKSASPPPSEDKSQNTLYGRKRLPYPRYSYLSTTEQKFYIAQFVMYKKKQPDPACPEYAEFLKLHPRLQKEQQDFNAYLRKVSLKYKEDYAFLQDVAVEYMQKKHESILKRLQQHNSFFLPIDQVPITTNHRKTHELQPVKILLQMGEVPVSFAFPNTKMKTVLDYHTIQQRFPTDRIQMINESFYSHQVCSEDENAQKLAQKYRCDMVLSSSVLKCLVDNHPPCFEKSWDIPVSVQEYQLEGPEKVMQKVVYLDKPFRRQQITRDINATFHKYSLAVRVLHPGHMSIHSFHPNSTVEKRSASDDGPNDPYPKDDDDDDIGDVSSLETFGTSASRTKIGTLTEQPIQEKRNSFENPSLENKGIHSTYPEDSDVMDVSSLETFGTSVSKSKLGTITEKTVKEKKNSAENLSLENKGINYTSLEDNDIMDVSSLETFGTSVSKTKLETLTEQPIQEKRNSSENPSLKKKVIHSSSQIESVSHSIGVYSDLEPAEENGDISAAPVASDIGKNQSNKKYLTDIHSESSSEKTLEKISESLDQNEPSSSDKESVEQTQNDSCSETEDKKIGSTEKSQVCSSSEPIEEGDERIILDKERTVTNSEQKDKLSTEIKSDDVEDKRSLDASVSLKKIKTDSCVLEEKDLKDEDSDSDPELMINFESSDTVQTSCSPKKMQVCPSSEPSEEVDRTIILNKDGTLTNTELNEKPSTEIKKDNVEEKGSLDTSLKEVDGMIILDKDGTVTNTELKENPSTEIKKDNSEEKGSLETGLKEIKTDTCVLEEKDLKDEDSDPSQELIINIESSDAIPMETSCSPEKAQVCPSIEPSEEIDVTIILNKEGTVTNEKPSTEIKKDNVEEKGSLETSLKEIKTACVLEEKKSKDEDSDPSPEGMINYERSDTVQPSCSPEKRQVCPSIEPSEEVDGTRILNKEGTVTNEKPSTEIKKDNVEEKGSLETSLKEIKTACVLEEKKSKDEDSDPSPEGMINYESSDTVQPSCSPEKRQVCPSIEPSEEVDRMIILDKEGSVTNTELNEKPSTEIKKDNVEEKGSLDTGLKEVDGMIILDKDGTVTNTELKENPSTEIKKDNAEEKGSLETGLKEIKTNSCVLEEKDLKYEDSDPSPELINIESSDAIPMETSCSPEKGQVCPSIEPSEEMDVTIILNEEGTVTNENPSTEIKKDNAEEKGSLETGLKEIKTDSCVLEEKDLKDEDSDPSQELMINFESSDAVQMDISCSPEKKKVCPSSEEMDGTTNLNKEGTVKNTEQKDKLATEIKRDDVEDKGSLHVSASLKEIKTDSCFLGAEDSEDEDSDSDPELVIHFESSDADDAPLKNKSVCGRSKISAELPNTPKSKVTQASATPGSPTVDALATPSTLTLDNPGSPTQDTPGSLKPDAPGSPTPDTPASPIPDAPGSPIPDAPASPTPDTPASPIPDAPASPTPDTPASPIPDAPGSPIPDAPSSPTTDAPGSPIPDAPASPTPDAPGSPIQDAPGSPIPDAPGSPSFFFQENLSQSFDRPMVIIPTESDTNVFEFDNIIPEHPVLPERKTASQSKKRKHNAAFGLGPLDSILEKQEELLKTTNRMKSVKIETKSSTTIPEMKTKNTFKLPEIDENPEDYLKPEKGNNVTYCIWNFGDLRLLVRCKYSAVKKSRRRKGFVYIMPKLEYQAGFGYEKTTQSEASQMWITSLIRHNCFINRVRINAFTSDIMMEEMLSFAEISELYNPVTANTFMYNLFQKLYGLKTGRYFVNHTARKNVCVISQAIQEKHHPQAFHLQNMYPQNIPIHVPEKNPWIALDPNLLLNYHEFYGRVPCTFHPPDLKKQFIAQGKKKKKKKKKKSTD